MRNAHINFHISPAIICPVLTLSRTRPTTAHCDGQPLNAPVHRRFNSTGGSGVKNIPRWKDSKQKALTSKLGKPGVCGNCGYTREPPGGLVKEKKALVDGDHYWGRVLVMHAISRCHYDNPLQSPVRPLAATLWVWMVRGRYGRRVQA